MKMVKGIAQRRVEKKRIPPMLLPGLISTASKLRKSERTLTVTQLEMEVMSQVGSGGLDEHKTSRSNMARIKLEGQLDVVGCSRIRYPTRSTWLILLVAMWRCSRRGTQPEGTLLMVIRRKPCRIVCRC